MWGGGESYTHVIGGGEGYEGDNREGAIPPNIPCTRTCGKAGVCAGGGSGECRAVTISGFRENPCNLTSWRFFKKSQSNMFHPHHQPKAWLSLPLSFSLAWLWKVIQPCENWVHCSMQGSEQPIFSVFAGNSSTFEPSKLHQMADFLSTACKAACLSNPPSLRPICSSPFSPIILQN